MGDITLRAGFDQRVPVTLHLLQLADASLQAQQNLPGFLADIGQLTVREKGHISDKDLAVVLQCEKCRSGSALTVDSVFLITGTRWTPRWGGTCR